MNKVKKALFLSLFIFTLTSTTSAFASDNINSYTTNQYSYSTSQYSTNRSSSNWTSIVDLLFSFCGVQITNFKTQKEVSDWIQKNIKDCPNEESYEIWQRWYCGGSERHDD